MNNGEVYLSDAIGIINEVLESGGEFLLSPKGTSMLPLIVHGQDRVVLKKYTGEAKKYDIAFYRRTDGAFVLHRIIKKQKDGSLLVNFKACGEREIIWHIFKWGKGCKINKPERLKETYKNYLKENLDNY